MDMLERDLAVLDTSFYVFVKNLGIEAACANSFFGRVNPVLIVPEIIKEMWDKIYRREKKGSLDPSELLGSHSSEFPEEGVEEDIEAAWILYNFSGLRDWSTARIPKYLGEMGSRDRSIIEAALTPTKGITYVITANPTITRMLKILRKENIKVLSPLGLLEAELPNLSNDGRKLEMLLTDDVYSSLMASNTPGRYVVVSQNHPITRTYDCDLGVKVVNEKVEVPESCYLMPFLEIKEKYARQPFFGRELPGFNRYFLKAGEKYTVFRVRAFFDNGLVWVSDSIYCSLISPAHIYGRGLLDARLAALGKKERQLAKAL